MKEYQSEGELEIPLLVRAQRAIALLSGRHEEAGTPAVAELLESNPESGWKPEILKAATHLLEIDRRSRGDSRIYPSGRSEAASSTCLGSFPDILNPAGCVHRECHRRRGRRACGRSVSTRGTDGMGRMSTVEIRGCAHQASPSLLADRAANGTALEPAERGVSPSRQAGPDSPTSKLKQPSWTSL